MQPRYKFPRTSRLSGRKTFSAVYDSGLRQSRGPLSIVSSPNHLPRLRLGLSVSRKVGSAVRRNRIKRLLRQVFRLLQHDLPGGYDLVVIVRPHEVLNLAEYQRLMQELIQRSQVAWQRRGSSQ
jgi:ribonuclease P protein component